jgi:hypothetical protein
MAEFSTKRLKTDPQKIFDRQKLVAGKRQKVAEKRLKNLL